MPDTLRLKSMPANVSTEKPTMALRFVEKHKRYILQQAYEIRTPLHTRLEWRDVPLVKENP